MGVQVQTATKNGQGNPLSILNRQFISFSYGGKNIEDFDLLAVFNGDRLSKEIYAPFNDTTTEQTELDGQMFWRSNFKAGQLNFTLATDGMTSKQLEEFKKWFEPGIEKEFILSENHNRGILARISTSPQISLLPFEKEVEVKVGEIVKKTKTSLYKGEISLSFVMDDPYWYSLESVLEKLEEEEVKLVYEDGIPHISMLKTECFLANNSYCSQDEENNFIIKDNEGISLLEEFQEGRSLYYCGTAKTSPEIYFELEPLYDADTGKISFYRNANSEKDYYYLRVGEAIEDSNKNYLLFTLPSIFSSYNKALEIANKYITNNSILELRKELRDSIYNYYTRSYTIALIDIAKNSRDYTTIEGLIKESFKEYFITEMKKFFTGFLSCNINCKTGAVTISGQVKQYKDFNTFEEKEITENAGNMIKSNYLTIEERKLPKDGLISSGECLEVKTNSNLFNLKINYKYMYL